jgi:hypothetical protein
LSRGVQNFFKTFFDALGMIPAVLRYKKADPPSTSMLVCTSADWKLFFKKSLVAGLMPTGTKRKRRNFFLRMA